MARACAQETRFSHRVKRCTRPSNNYLTMKGCIHDRYGHLRRYKRINLTVHFLFPFGSQRNPARMYCTEGAVCVDRVNTTGRFDAEVHCLYISLTMGRVATHNTRSREVVVRVVDINISADVTRREEHTLLSCITGVRIERKIDSLLNLLLHDRLSGLYGARNAGKYLCLVGGITVTVSYRGEISLTFLAVREAEGT